jgi:hypothetical protein
MVSSSSNVSDSVSEAAFPAEEKQHIQLQQPKIQRGWVFGRVRATNNDDHVRNVKVTPTCLFTFRNLLLFPSSFLQKKVKVKI